MYRKEYFPHNCLQTIRFYNQKCEPTDENRDLLASTSVPSQDPTTFWDRWSGWPILDLNSSMERSWRELSIDFGVIVSSYNLSKWCRVPCGDRSSFTQNRKLRDDSKSKSNLWCISLGKWYHPMSRATLISGPTTLKFTAGGRKQGKNSATPGQNPWNPQDFGVETQKPPR